MLIHEDDTDFDVLYYKMKNTVKAMYANGDFDNKPYVFNPHIVRQRIRINKDALEYHRNQWFQESITHFDDDLSTESPAIRQPGISLGYIRVFTCRFNVFQRTPQISPIDGPSAVPFTLSITIVKKQDANFNLYASLTAPTHRIGTTHRFDAGHRFHHQNHDMNTILGDFENIFLEVPLCKFILFNGVSQMDLLNNHEWVQEYRRIEQYYKTNEEKRLQMVRGFTNKGLPVEVINHILAPHFEYRNDPSKYKHLPSAQLPDQPSLYPSSLYLGH